MAATNLLARMLTPKNETMNAMAFWEHGSAQATHLFDFTTNDGSNLAYSRDEILAHTNGAYLATPPRVKLMHCVHFDGGEHDGYPDNFFVHAGRATIELTAEERVTLATHAVGVSYVDGKSGVESHAEGPVLAYDASGSLARARYNRHDRSALTDTTIDRALNAFDAQLNRTALQLHLVLRPGEAVLLDNWHVLHGRGGYSGGRRRLVGADFANEHLQRRMMEAAAEKIAPVDPVALVVDAGRRDCREHLAESGPNPEQ